MVVSWWIFMYEFFFVFSRDFLMWILKWEKKRDRGQLCALDRVCQTKSTETHFDTERTCGSSYNDDVCS